jgi:hypothetical protein
MIKALTSAGNSVRVVIKGPLLRPDLGSVCRSAYHGLTAIEVIAFGVSYREPGRALTPRVSAFFGRDPPPATD